MMSKPRPLARSRPCWHPRTLRRWVADRRATVALLFGLMVFPIAGLVGLAVDYTYANQARAALTLAANGAALNAVKIAATEQSLGMQTYLADGQVAGTQWFNAQIGLRGSAATLQNVTPTVTVSENAADTLLTAKVSYTAQMNSIFGRLFNVFTYSLGNEVDATISLAPYLQIQVLVDNSSSMLIGASPTDMQTMMQISACAPSEVATEANGNIPPNAAWAEYSCGLSGWTYSLTSCPVPVSSPWTVGTLTPPPTGSSIEYGPSCQGQPGISRNADGTWPYAAAPCAFACHSDGTKALGSGNDLFGIARGTIGTANPVTLRLDVLKNALNTVISDMSAANISSINNLSLGIWDYNSTLNQDYPSSTSGQVAGSDFVAAATAVGSPPKTAHGAESGIVPDLQVSGAAVPDSYFSNASSLLTTKLTAAGNGTTATAPRKVLILIGDGLSDTKVNGTRTVALWDTSVCTTFKKMGYHVYVLYTPYYPVAERDYVTKFHINTLVEPTASSQSVTNLQSCASAPADYILASDQAGITTALQTFLRSALAGATILTR